MRFITLRVRKASFWSSALPIAVAPICEIRLKLMSITCKVVLRLSSSATARAPSSPKPFMAKLISLSLQLLWNIVIERGFFFIVTPACRVTSLFLHLIEHKQEHLETAIIYGTAGKENLNYSLRRLDGQ